MICQDLRERLGKIDFDEEFSHSERKGENLRLKIITEHCISEFV